VFYSARGLDADNATEFRARYQIGVATFGLNGRSVRQAMLVDGASATKRAAPLVPHELTQRGALTNNAQEPSVVWTGSGWELFFIGLGISRPAAPMNATGQRILSVNFLRASVGPDLEPPSAADVTNCSTGETMNIVEVRRLPDGVYHAWYTVDVLARAEYHHGEVLAHATSDDGITWRGHERVLAGTSPQDSWGAMAPTVALDERAGSAVLLYTAWQEQDSPCFPIARGGRFGNVLSGGRCVLSNVGRAVAQ
jgi:hypothetical protein